MDARRKTWPQLAAAIVMAIAFAAVWVMIGGWIGFFVSSLWPTDRIYEDIEVARDGTPLIESRSNVNWSDVTYRSLDGKAVDFDPKQSLVGASLAGPVIPPGLYEEGVPWSARIAGLTDGQRPPVLWYLVRDAAPLGHAYLVGYDQFSKLPVGYISRAGFSRAIPARDQWFSLGRHQLGWGSTFIVSMGQQIGYGTIPYGAFSSDSTQGFASWKPYVVDDDRLLEIDLRAHTCRPVYQAAGLLGAAFIYAPIGKVLPADAPAPKTDEEESEASFKVRWGLAVRTADRIVVLDSKGGAKGEFVLPPALRDAEFNAYQIPSNELLIVHAKDNDRAANIQLLDWLKPDGTVTQHKEVILARINEPSDQSTAWFGVPLAPVPVGWGIALSVIAPISMLQNRFAASYVQALTKNLSFTGLPFLVVLLIGGLLGWRTLQLQRKYRRPASRTWVTFVFLFGLPGFLAYWIERRRTKLENCTKCGEIVPRDRDACAACDTGFAPPARVGTEIFA